MWHLGYTSRRPATPAEPPARARRLPCRALLAPAAHAAVAAPERVQAISPANSLAKGVNSTCPAGKRALGVGGRIVTSTGQVVMDDLAPNAALTGATAFGAEDGNGYSENWAGDLPGHLRHPARRPAAGHRHAAPPTPPARA